MRILHCVYTVDPVYGGSFEAARQFSLAHLEMGHEVEIASLDLPDRPFLRNFPIKVHPLGWSTIKYGYSPHWVPWLKANHHRFDAIIVNGIFQYNSFGTWRALRGTSTPYFVYTHGYLDPWFRRAFPLKHFKKLLYWPWADYRVLRDARATLFTCEDEEIRSHHSFSLYKCHPRIATLGIQRPPGDPERQREVFLEQYPFLKGQQFVLYLSKIHEKKGVMHLMDAFGTLAQEEKELFLVMAGPGKKSYVESVRARLAPYGKEVESRVIWTGMLEGDLKWGAYRAADIFILPSHTENFGIAVVEALACRLPVLITPEINIWREIVNDDAGWAEKDDKEGTIRNIRRWLQLPPEEKEAMRLRALECYNNKFEIKQAAQHLIDVLQEEIDRI